MQTACFTLTSLQLERHRKASPIPPLRVCIVAPSDRQLGGHSVQAATLVRQLAPADGVAVRRLDTDLPLPSWCAAVDDVPYLRTVVRMCWFLPALAREARRADVLHVFTAAYWAFLLVAATSVAVGRAMGTPVIVNYHSGEAPDHLRRHRRLVKPVLRRAAALVVPSRYLARVFEEHGFVCDVIPNAVEVGIQGNGHRRPPYDRFLCTRNHEPEYDVPTVVRAFARIHRQEPSARLTLVGVGSQTEIVRALVRDLGLDAAVDVVGAVPHDRIAAFYREADLFLNASRVDNQPISILEAMAAGLLVVSTGTGGIGELLTEGAGRVVPRGRPDLMSAAALAVMNDGEAFTRTVRRAWQVVAEHDGVSVSGAWHRLYRDLAGRIPEDGTAGVAGGKRLDGCRA